MKEDGMRRKKACGVWGLPATDRQMTGENAEKSVSSVTANESESG